MGTLCLLVALGGLTTMVLPAKDEYAAFAEIGKPITQWEYEVHQLPAKDRSIVKSIHSGVPPLAGKKSWPGERLWLVTASEPETTAFIRAFASPKSGWYCSGGGNSTESDGTLSATAVSTYYENVETGDQLEYEVKRYMPSKFVKRKVEITSSPERRNAWTKMKRWARRTFTGR